MSRTEGNVQSEMDAGVSLSQYSHTEGLTKICCDGVLAGSHRLVSGDSAVENDS